MGCFSFKKRILLFLCIIFLNLPGLCGDNLQEPEPAVMKVTKPRFEVPKVSISPSKIINVAVVTPVKKVANAKPVKTVTNKLPFKKKKSKKIYFEDVKNNAPKTFDEYISMSKEIRREDIKLPEPKYDRDTDKIDFPDPKVQIKKYNVPPGTQDIDLTMLVKQRKVNSIGAISPDHTRMVYSSVYYYPTENQTSSDMYAINLDSSLPLETVLKTANPLNQDYDPILTAGTDDLMRNSIKSLVLVDWSADGKKVAVKEKIGSNRAGIWKTSLLVYDFEKQQGKDLNELREAIRYWWKNNKNLDLIDYMWDIYPVGWDAVNPDRIIVYAFAFSTKRPKFLGTWSIDANGDISQLLSLDRTDFAISTNGLKLKIIPHY